MRLRTVSAFWLLTAAVLAARAATLITVAQDNSAPKFISTQAGMTGFCMDALRAIERVDPNLHFVGTQSSEPPARIDSRLANGTLDVACGRARNAARASYSVEIEPALFNARYAVAVRADDPVFVSNLDDIRKLGPNGTLLGVRGLSVMTQLAAEGGLLIDDAAITPDANLKKLLAGRGRFFIYRSPGLKTQIHEAGLDSQVRVLPAVIYTTRLYMVASRHLAPGLVHELGRAIAELNRTGELMRIYERWGELER